MKEAEGHLNNPRDIFGAKPGPSKLGGAECSGVPEGAAQEGTDYVVPAFHNKSLPCTVQATHENNPYPLYLLTLTWKLSIISQRNFDAC